MTARIVDVLEVIQVNQQQSPTLATARRQAQCHFQALHQFAAIGQQSQRILARKNLKFTMQKQALGVLMKNDGRHNHR